MPRETPHYEQILEEHAHKINAHTKEEEKHALKTRIENDFIYHTPIGDQQERYQTLRSKAKELALMIIELTPVSREQAIALTHLETASMFANAAIARNS